MSPLENGKVLAPVDFSDFSFESLATALEFAGDADRLHIVHVLPPLLPMEPGVVWGAIEDQGRVGAAEKALRDRLSGGPCEKARIHIAFGNPGREIAELAEKLEVDLIVIPSHGHTGAMHLLLGSVAERVVHFAPCPVFVLKKKPEE